jgi:hypothetical protein
MDEPQTPNLEEMDEQRASPVLAEPMSGPSGKTK